jgi:hypothetical protein
MFVHFLEASPPLQMNCQVILPEGRLQRAEFVTQKDGALRAFWIEVEGDNPAYRRFFAQKLPSRK